MAAQSARGLFRATDKKSKPVNVMLNGEIVQADGLEREKDDFYPTPPEPTRAFIAAEYPRLKTFDKIWEPAAGDGAMVREMQSCGFDVVASDLIDRGCDALIRDFYDFKVPPAKALITNPPFNECNWRDGQGRWITHALESLKVEYMALLLSWSWPAAAGLARLYADHPPARVYLMRWKIDFTGQGAPPMSNAWFVWDKRWQGETALRMLDRSMDARQSQLFSEAAI